MKVTGRGYVGVSKVVGGRDVSGRAIKALGAVRSDAVAESITSCKNLSYLRDKLTTSTTVSRNVVDVFDVPEGETRSRASPYKLV